MSTTPSPPKKNRHLTLHFNHVFSSAALHLEAIDEWLGWDWKKIRTLIRTIMVC